MEGKALGKHGFSRDFLGFPANFPTKFNLSKLVSLRPSKILVKNGEISKVMKI